MVLIVAQSFKAAESMVGEPESRDMLRQRVESVAPLKEPLPVGSGNVSSWVRKSERIIYCQTESHCTYIVKNLLLQLCNA